MRFKQWLDKRLGGCLPARSWRRKKKPTQHGRPHHHHHHNHHNSFEIRLTRRWVFERPTTPPSPSSSSTHSTDPLTGAGVEFAAVPSSPRSCNFPTREVTKLRRTKSTASIPKQVIRKLSVTPPKTPPAVAVVAAAAAVTPVAGESAEEEVEEVEEEEEEDEEEERARTPEQEPVRRRFFAEVDQSGYDRLRERVADHLPEATVVYTNGRPGEEEEERRVDEDAVRSVIVPQTAVESSFPSNSKGTVSSVIVLSTAVTVYKGSDEEVEERAVTPVIVPSAAVNVVRDLEEEVTVSPVIALSATVESAEDEKITVKPVIVPSATVENCSEVTRENEEEEVVTVKSVIVPSTAVENSEEARPVVHLDLREEEKEEQAVVKPAVEEEKRAKESSPVLFVPTQQRPKTPPPSKPKSKKTVTQLPTPSASASSEQDHDSDNDSGFTPTPPDVIDEAADRARFEEISGWALQREDDEDLPGSGALIICSYPWTHDTSVLTENHRLRRPKSSILKPFDPPLIFEDMSTPSDSTKPVDAAVAPAPPAKGKKAAADKQVAGAQAATGDKKLTGKELKEAKKAEKQARRAADKAQRGDVPDAATASSGGAPTKQAQSSTSPGNQSGSSKPTQQQQQGQKGKQQQAAPSTDGDVRIFGELEYKHIPFFDHLKENKPPFDLAKVNRDVHPSVLRLAMKLRNFEIMGSTARVLYMLLAFKDVIRDYITPEGAALSRNFTQHLGLQISQIAAGRKLSVSQGNAIRWLKTIASRVPPEIPDEEAKQDLIASIDTYMKERILVAQDVIANVASEKISNGDVILTYAKSSCVERVLRRALLDGKTFSVVVIDSRPHFEGRGMAKSLVRAGIQVKYTTLHALDHVMKKVNKVFLGAHAVYANGACYSRAGTSAVAMTAAEYQKPVMICCEGLKLSDKIVMDSITTNELGPTEALIGEDSPLQNHSEIPNLHIVNLLYDLTLPKYITAVITETGFTPPFGIPSVFRLLAEREGTVGAS
ncbi:hypothetical protein TWF281_010003 [Arthrobotrys megalospora]